MKKHRSIITVLSFFFFVMSVNAQTSSTDYFAGKWSVLLKGIPGGDAKMIFILDKKDTTITGVVQDSTGAEIAKLSNVELKGDEITLYFTAQGYDVSLLLKKKDNDHVTGSLMGMFDAEGERLNKDK